MFCNNKIVDLFVNEIQIAKIAVKSVTFFQTKTSKYGQLKLLQSNIR